MTCGIYKIVNNANGKFYLGSSSNIKLRWKTHRYQLRHNKHHSIHLQRAWNKHGEFNFTFEIVQEKSIGILLEAEQKLLDKLMPWKEEIGYNTSKFSSGGDMVSYHPNLHEIKEKHRRNTKQRWECLTEEDKLAYSRKMKGEGNPNWKGGANSFTCPVCGHTILQRQQRSCGECRNRNKENNSFYGKKHSKESIKKMSEHKKLVGNKYNIQKISVIVDGVVYSSFSKAAYAIGCSIATIRNRLNKPTKFPNYKLVTPPLEL